MPWDTSGCVPTYRDGTENFRFTYHAPFCINLSFGPLTANPSEWAEFFDDQLKTVFSWILRCVKDEYGTVNERIVHRFISRQSHWVDACNAYINEHHNLPGPHSVTRTVRYILICQIKDLFSPCPICRLCPGSLMVMMLNGHWALSYIVENHMKDHGNLYIDLAAVTREGLTVNQLYILLQDARLRRAARARRDNIHMLEN